MRSNLLFLDAMNRDGFIFRRDESGRFFSDAMNRDGFIFRRDEL
jgi:hypothetical protein